MFRQQALFISYRLMRAGANETAAVAKWESEELGKIGAENYRRWLKESGMWDKLVLQIYDGEVVASS